MTTKRRKKTACYTVKPGRQIYRRGQPFISIVREGGEYRGPSAAEVDRMTRTIARVLNRRGCR